MKNPRAILTLCFFLVLLTFFPFTRWRDKAITTVALLSGKVPAIRGGQSQAKEGKEQELERLQALQISWQKQMEMMREILVSEARIEKFAEQFAKTSLDEKYPAQFKKNARYLHDLFLQTSLAIPAKVIYREPLMWNHFLWVDVGQEDNERLQANLIAKNSPVVIGNQVVGIVEEVKKKTSKVRLISDSSLALSVRASRGEEQNFDMLRRIEGVEKSLQYFENPALSWEKKQQCMDVLASIKELITPEKGSKYLAKGIIQGMGYPLWRMPANILQGTGFNYEYADDEGPSIDLRDRMNPLLQVGDLLVTTGYDGIFPKGLLVGTVVAIDPLNPEDFSYRLKARAAVENIHEIEFVSILAPAK